MGIGGGVPTRTDDGLIRLGHVVISKPVIEHSGAVQYDHGKAKAGQFRRTCFLTPPPFMLLNTAQRMVVERVTTLEDPLCESLKRIDTSRRRLRRFKHPGPNRDTLYRAGYMHRDPSFRAGSGVATRARFFAARMIMKRIEARKLLSTGELWQPESLL